MKCSSCDKQKHELNPRNSRLMKTMKLFLCSDCDKNKFEPRWIIILVGRANGLPAVAEYIKKGRYVGEPITAKELA